MSLQQILAIFIGNLVGCTTTCVLVRSSAYERGFRKGLDLQYRSMMIGKCIKCVGDEFRLVRMEDKHGIKPD